MDTTQSMFRMLAHQIGRKHRTIVAKRTFVLCSDRFLGLMWHTVNPLKGCYYTRLGVGVLSSKHRMFVHSFPTFLLDDCTISFKFCILDVCILIPGICTR